MLSQVLPRDKIDDLDRHTIQPSLFLFVAYWLPCLGSLPPSP